jgi:sialate O-acetylesterase
VNGRLRAAGKVAGFSIHNSAGGLLPLVYAVDIDPRDGAAVLIRLTGKLPAGAVLRYGYGTDPYCNLTDDADMAAPAFGPMAIQ